MKKLNFKSCYYSNRLIDKIKQLNEISSQKVDIAQIEKAIYYAKKYHGNQKRQTGELYHPLEVAYMLANYTATRKSEYYQTHILVTAILHDTIEDSVP
ncbi:hypothetical protein [Rickettsia endosymbiont of Orchestes rusci]|uniref:hypothetical protein n=1 Tax=Rickettsia endosymbiont of Orchestes rusci TaxID=3066250 RepID=UPI00313EC161